ncbi:MAG: hypothetical protein QOE93_1457, partial [Actinomycetota bacterium]|nr:hypothetical protein [Actinomycetota bacterium]
MSRRSPRPAPVVLALALVAIVVAASIALVLRLTGDDDPDTKGTATATPTSAPPTTGDITATPGAPPAGTSDLSPDQRRTVDRLKEQVSDIRGLEWKADLPVRIVDPGELARRLNVLTIEDREEHPEDLPAVEAVLKLLQLIPPDLDFADTIDRLLAGGVLGFYDDEAKELYVGGDPGSDLDVATQATMVHELTHALTDQNFDFGARNQALGERDLSEEILALGALVEGDAELVRILWEEEHLTGQEQVEAHLGGGADPSVYLDMPPYILESLFFPYTVGLDFVQTLHDNGGFALVDSAYRQPPTSSEEILHPDLYVPGRTWTRPALPDLAAATGCTVLDTSTIGEFDMFQVLDQELSQSEAEKAVAGWNGDAYGLVRCGTAVGMADR